MRRAAARGKADSCQPECIRAIKLLGLPHRVLSAVGGGVGDILVLMPIRMAEVTVVDSVAFGWSTFVQMPAYFLEMECKVPQNKKGTVKASQYTEAQKKWRAQTPNGPRITVTGFEDTLRQLRDLIGNPDLPSPPKTADSASGL